MDTKNRIEILQAEAAIQKLVEEISRYSAHSREAEIAIKSIQDAMRELTINRESFDSFFQKTQDKLQQNAAISIAEIKDAVEHLIKCVSQENKENERFHQTNNQLQALAGKFEGIIQSVNHAIESIRQSLTEKLQNLEQTLTPFKDTVVRQEVTLGQFSSDFVQLTTNLGEIQQTLRCTIQNLEQILIEIKTGFSTINQQLDSVQNTANLTNKSLEKLSKEVISSLNKFEKILSEPLSKSNQDQQEYNTAINHFLQIQARTIKFSKWNMLLAFFNLVTLVGSLIYFFIIHKL